MIARRFGWFLFVTLTLLSVRDAYADNVDDDGTHANAAAHCDASPPGFPGNTNYKVGGCSQATHGTGNKAIKRTATWGPNEAPTQFSETSWHIYHDAGCVLPLEFDDATNTCVDRQAACLAKNDTLPQPNTQIYTGQQCINGCVYGARSGKTGTTSDGTLAMIFGEIGFTGATCSTNSPNPPDPNQENKAVCIPGNDGVKICSKPNGDTCYGASTGRFICWKPGEVGQKQDGNVVQKREPGTKNPPTPPTPPPGETVSQSSTPKTTTQTTINNTTNTTTTTNWTTGNGTNPGGDPAGEPDDGSGGGEGDGEGDGPGEAGPGLGADGPYEGDGRTVSDVISDFKSRIDAAPIRNVAQTFFTMNISGSCPVWTVPESEFTPTLTLSIHCSSEFASIWANAAWVVLAVAAFCAFRIAIY